MHVRTKSVVIFPKKFGHYKKNTWFQLPTYHSFHFGPSNKWTVILFHPVLLLYVCWCFSQLPSLKQTIFILSIIFPTFLPRNFHRLFFWRAFYFKVLQNDLCLRWNENELHPSEETKIKNGKIKTFHSKIFTPILELIS